MLLRAVKDALLKMPPVLLAQRNYRLVRRDFDEHEMHLLPCIVDPAKIAIDVGAHSGGYTHLLLKLGAEVVAIEANPKLADMLGRMYGSRAKVISAAASSRSGTITLRIPQGASNRSNGIATVEAANSLDDADVLLVEVPQVVLDELGLGPVGFIKVDVEGHEFEVLCGARRMIEQWRPTILVESEERHKPGSLQNIRSLLEPLGYNGFMLVDGRLSSIRNFSYEQDQAVPRDQLAKLNAGEYEGRYINNFLFVP